MATLKAYWKRFAASVTGFASRYRHDVFYRTGWNVVVLQVLFVTVLLAIVAVSLNLLYDEIIQGLVDALTHMIATKSTTLDTLTITSSLEYEKQKNLVLTATGILIGATIFSWLITRMALTPTREALDTQKLFIGNVAHELRTPLSIIKTNTEVALFNEKLDRGTRDTLESNVEELDRISDIINNLLSISSLLRPEKMMFEYIDLSTTVTHTGAVLASLAEHKGVKLAVHAGQKQPLYGNPAALDQIAMNIAKNAINYTPPGGNVLLETGSSKGDGTVWLRVNDTGTGIAEKDLAHIFEPFYRGDQSRNRKAGGGSGLGLAIVSDLVKIHKGQIDITSTPGVGTTVVISFPMAKQEGVQERREVWSSLSLGFKKPKSS